MIGWRTLCASKAAVFGVYSEITWLLALGQIYVYPELKKKSHIPFINLSRAHASSEAASAAIFSLLIIKNSPYFSISCFW